MHWSLTVLWTWILGFATDSDDVRGQVLRMADAIRTVQSRRDLAVSIKTEGVEREVAKLLRTDVICEFQVAEHRAIHAFVLFTPRDTTVQVLQLTLSTWDAEAPRWVPPLGFAGAEGAVSPRDYERFVRAAVLISRIELASREDVTAPVPTRSAQKMPIGELRIRVGDLWDGGGTLTPNSSVEGIIDTEVPDAARAYLYSRILEGVLDKADMARCENLDLAASHLARRIGSVGGWRRALRSRLLGWIGGREERDMLLRLAPETVTQRAALQIELRTAIENGGGPERLLGLLEHSDDEFFRWARQFLTRRFTEAYKDWLTGLYDRTEGVWERRAILDEFVRVDPNDTGLFVVALNDQAAMHRVVAAKRLGKLHVLTAIATDKTLMSEPDLLGRSLAIRYLADVPAGQIKVVGETLVEILKDGEDDIDLRRASAEAIGCLGFNAAVPTLLNLLKEPMLGRAVVFRKGSRGVIADRKRYELLHDLRFGLVHALGRLRAPESVCALEKLVRRGIVIRQLGKQSLAAAAGYALAQVGEPGSLAILQEALETAGAGYRDAWKDAIGLLNAIREGDGVEILRASNRPVKLGPLDSGMRCERFWIELLAEVVALESLERLANECTDKRGARLAGAAIKLKRSRGQ